MALVHAAALVIDHGEQVVGGACRTWLGEELHVEIVEGAVDQSCGFGLQVVLSV